MERFAVKDFLSGGYHPTNIENEIYCSDYLCMVNLMTTSACCLLKRIAYSKKDIKDLWAHFLLQKKMIYCVTVKFLF